ncbi:MAG: glycerol-3-phosphate dehydrogenase [Chlamydiales bacterium]|jgi:glycerol-3-phosphate dehydrogenase
MRNFLFFLLFAFAEVSAGTLPSREELIQRSQKENFDILVIGGGATGTGIALDAITRGYSVLLVEQEDFASQTSSSSTKLLHGGVRYLEKAFTHLDWSQYYLVKEALHERSTLLKIAPHLTWKIPILLPLYSRLEIPYFWLGMKAYDKLSGKYSLGPSQYINRKKTLERFPQVKKKGLKGGIIYWDGQFDDARLNLAIALTAISKGAVVLNHMKMLILEKEDGLLTSVVIQDTLSRENWSVKASIIVNATGAFVDTIRRLDDPQAPPLLSPSIGSHLVFPPSFAPKNLGMLIPKTADGRVLFLLPWRGVVLAGTTDHPSRVVDNPQPSIDEVNEILLELGNYLEKKPKKEDILAAWSGLRPLVIQGEKNSSNTSREHVIEHSASGLYSIAGGKWTTYRKMAEDLVDRLLTDGALPEKGPCVTADTMLYGSKRIFPPGMALGNDISNYLYKTYGDEALEIETLALNGNDVRLVKGLPYTKAELIFLLQKKYAFTAEDVLFRRIRLGFTDHQATLSALPAVIELMEKTLSWSPLQSYREYTRVIEKLSTLEPIKYEIPDSI